MHLFHPVSIEILCIPKDTEIGTADPPVGNIWGSSRWRTASDGSTVLGHGRVPAFVDKHVETIKETCGNYWNMWKTWDI